ncbi:hypothetical protein ACQCSX_06610 [Pseudarthrobacter sp. P1]|uniref:hypothetical protein n=1 Tax=Pseudarthrobacter sp. P1 TaxID=3418418 RepID=UPI003CEBEE9B
MTENPYGEQDASSRARHRPPGADVTADPVRSGADVAEAIEIAESGTAVQGMHSHSEQSKSGEAPVEQVFGDPAMTTGRSGTGSAGTEQAVPPRPSPAEAGSGGAQSVIGARESDRLAAGAPPAAGSPFDTDSKDDDTGI